MRERRKKLTIAALLAFGACPSDCRVCEQPGQEQARRNWGCDGPALQPFPFTCWLCRGRSATCSICSGTGTVMVERCPRAILDRAAAEVCGLQPLIEVGILPVEGGWRDQAAVFIDAVRFVAMEREHYRKEPGSGAE